MATHEGIFTPDDTKTATVPGGQPQALTAVAERHILAATQDGIYESRDAGKTFTKRLSVASGDYH
ncbi:hypothetical protein ABZ958_06900 [Streptomyces sp. NPDC046237]|uniref:hypothetical protein n=1 Tax=Streptomyces sp. NPDC046237 TaxID=3154914 RepID=UPI0034051420